MTISLLAAADENYLIGARGKLPWPRLPEDMKYFYRLSKGHAVIMGRKTYESVGKPFANRVNIVLTSQAEEIERCFVAHDLKRALEIAERELPGEEVFIIGGGEVFRQAINPRWNASKIYLTLVHSKFEGDVYFPKLDLNEWKEVDREPHPADEKNVHPYTFLVYERKK